MKRIRLLILYVVLFLGILYGLFLFVLPVILNNQIIINKIEKTILKRTGITAKSDSFKFIAKPDLTVKTEVQKIYLKDKDTELLTAKKLYLTYDLKTLKIKNLNIEYIFINKNGFKNLVNKNKNKKASDFKLKTFPQIKINKAEIWVDNGELNSVFITLANLDIKNSSDNKTYCTFEAEIMSNLLKNLINIGRKGYLYIDDNALYAKDLLVNIGTSDLNINGKIIDDNKQSDFLIQGNDLPINDIETSLLYFQKLKKKDKVFIENFYDFSGLMNVNLQVKETGIYGTCETKNLGAKTTLFNVPAAFPNVIFYFDKKNINAQAKGTLGKEKVYTKFSIHNTATKEQSVEGIVIANLTDKFANNYIPELTITRTVDASVYYTVKNKKIYVDYLLKIPKNSDLRYKHSNLGLTDKDRRLLVNTLKETDKLHIKHYDYSTEDETGIKFILLGEGLLVKKQGHLAPDYLTCRTRNEAPISVIGSLKRYVQGGFFSGDLKYDFNKKLATGIFIIKESNYKNFYVKKAMVDANSKRINISAEGTYKKSPFNCAFEAKNELGDKIRIYKMFLFLDEFIIETSKNKAKAKNIDIQKEAQEIDIDLDIDEWNIELNKIKRNRIEITNILLNGSLVNNIFKFSMPNANFAKGKLNAKGKYNIKNQDAEIDFTAQNIDSNTASDIIFNLPNQIQGLANASLKAKFKNGFNNVNAKAHFSVKQGFLPQLGSTEFMIKKSRMIKRPLKFKVSDIVNIDMKNMKALSSDIEGNFAIDNYDLKNVKITSSQKYLSMLIEGDYNLKKENGELNLLGKYNKEEVRRVKILFVPLGWILKFAFKPENTYEIYKDKLKEVPKINADKEEESAFRVKVKGDLNKRDIYVELKSII